MRVTSEGPVKITKATIDAGWRRRKPDHRQIIRDKDCRGLALIVNATSMAWSYAYRPRGINEVTQKRWPNRTVTLGNPASLSIDDARIEANRIKGRAAAGNDPVAEIKKEKATAREKLLRTVARLLDDYRQALPKRLAARGGGSPSKRYIAGEAAQLLMAIGEIGVADKPIEELDIADVRRLLETEANPRARFGAFSRFLDWCHDRGEVPINPCTLIARGRRPKPPRARARYLTPIELARLWNGAGQLSAPVWRDLMRFLIALPCRRGEAISLEWSHIDLEACEWRQPGRLTKNRDPHRLHLHPLALEVLRARRSATSGNGLVFPAPVSNRVIDAFSYLKKLLSEAAGTSDWSFHDFRRSFATALGEAGIPEVVADAVLNHRQSATRGGVLGVYQRASRWPEQVKAMQLWGRLLAAAIEGRAASAEVVQLHGASG